MVAALIAAGNDWTTGVEQASAEGLNLSLLLSNDGALACARRPHLLLLQKTLTFATRNRINCFGIKNSRSSRCIT